MPTDDNVNRAWCALAQDGVDIIQSHVVNHRVIDLCDLVPVAESIKREFKDHRADKTRPTSVFRQLLYRIVKNSGSSELCSNVLKRMTFEYVGN